ncbi:MAG: HEAT repeat domain-containing protein [Acidobacteria bacterium]|nr:HEAT repeat domain-containing protein [Acidobacteriota bacterium]
MAHVFAFNTAVQIAWWTGILFAMVSLMCLFVMLMLRSKAVSVSRRREQVTNGIEEVLFHATEFIGNTEKIKDENLPVLSSDDDIACFLQEWNYLQESLAGEAKTGLNELIHKMGLFERVLKMIRGQRLDRRLLAINTLGNLRDTRSYNILRPCADDADPVVSSWAWRAVMRLNCDTCFTSDLRMIAERKDWSPIFVADVLKDKESDDLSVPLASLVLEHYEANLEERQMSRLISYLAFTHVADHECLIERILNESDEKEVLIACLRLLHDEASLPRIRELARDDRWEVRLQAVLTLGRFGHSDDIPVLIASLNDTDWWVRYRAASTLVQMPSVSAARVKELTATLPNEFARDILLQVEAEMELLCFKPSSLALSK